MTKPDWYSAVQSAAGVATRPRDRRGTVAIRDITSSDRTA